MPLTASNDRHARDTELEMIGRRRDMKRTSWRTRLALGIAALVVAGACTSTPPSSGSTPRPTGALVTAEPSRPGGLTSDGKILVRWFVGLGTGGNPEQLGAESAA